MDKNKIYEDIARRTGGDVYIGVVGPVRTGKSTFIKRFMETLVLPRIGNDYVRERARDELPQSGSGRTIMTAEPKFVPEDAVSITVDGDASLAVRLIDCVGYMVEGAVGHMEDGSERLVTTPWFSEEVPMSVAAEEGTRRVISEHSTIGIVVTNDGTVTDIPREAYVEPEERVISELKALGKPFIILVNSVHPEDAGTRELARALGEKHGVTAMAVNCMTLSEADVTGILQSVLREFPVSEFDFTFPSWVEALEPEHPIIAGLMGSIREALADARCVRDVKGAVSKIVDEEKGIAAKLLGIDMGTGTVSSEIEVPRELFYAAIGEVSGFDVKSDGDMLRLLGGLAGLKSRYERVAEALDEVRERGYGVVMPEEEELILREPEIVRRGGRYQVRLKATAPAIHMIMTEVETEVSPAMGGEKSSGDVINFLLQEYEGDTGRLWESNIFGKSLHDIAGDSLRQKIRSLPPETQLKLRDTLARITNEGAGGLICIIL